MSEPAKSRPAAQTPNIQDMFLNLARREKFSLQIRLMDGSDFEGRVKNFDKFALIIEHSGADHLVFKHAIASIRSPKALGNYFSSHEG
jgi:host factor-I protein